MKISFGTDEALGRVIMNVRAQSGDGVPTVPTLWIDSRNRLGRPQHLAVAATILLDRFIGEILALHPPCSPATAAAIRRFLEPRAVQVIANEKSPPGPAEGSRQALVGNVRLYREGFSVRLATDTQVRTTVDVDEAVFASNLRTLLPSHQTDAVIELALTILFSGNLYVDSILADRTEFSHFSDARLLALVELVAEAGITLVFTTALGPKGTDR